MTLQVEITPEIEALLKDERYTHPQKVVRKRLEVLWLKSQGLPHAQIAQLAGVGQTAVREYLHLYKEQGLAGLRQVNYYRPVSELESHQAVLSEYFKAHPPATIAQAQEAIVKLTGLQRGATQTREFLKKNSVTVGVKLGRSPLKPTPKPKLPTLPPS